MHTRHPPLFRILFHYNHHAHSMPSISYVLYAHCRESSRCQCIYKPRSLPHELNAPYEVTRHHVAENHLRCRQTYFLIPYTSGPHAIPSVYTRFSRNFLPSFPSTRISNSSVHREFYLAFPKPFKTKLWNFNPLPPTNSLNPPPLTKIIAFRNRKGPLT